MPIIGFNLSKISVEKFSQPNGPVNVEANIDIKEVEEIKDQEIGLSRDRVPLKYNFEFNLKYEPNVANINFKGHVLGVETEKIAREILKDSKKGKLDEELELKLKNFIWIKCTLKSFSLEEETGLPLHFPLPILSAKKKQGFVG